MFFLCMGIHHSSADMQILRKAAYSCVSLFPYTRGQTLRLPLNIMQPTTHHMLNDHFSESFQFQLQN